MKRQDYEALVKHGEKKLVSIRVRESYINQILDEYESIQKFIDDIIDKVFNPQDESEEE